MKPKKIVTLCLIHEHPKLLLGLKKRGFGAGLWNGFGGKVNPDESVEDAARREFREETGIEILNMDKYGTLDFEFQNGETGLEMHIFKITEYSGYPVESEEMKPQWFNIDEIPFRDMWSDDIYWFPLFLKNKKFTGRFLFDKPSTPEYRAKIIEREVKSLSKSE